MMDGKRLCIIMVLLAIIFTCLGGTLAVYEWETDESQKTLVVFTAGGDYTCAVDGGGDITSSDIVLAPSTCDNSKYAIKRAVKVMPSIYVSDQSVLMNLWIDINDLGSGLSNSQNFRYVFTTNENSCTEDVVRSGSFNGKTVGDSIPLLNYMGYKITTVETYYLYIWLDEDETSTETMNQSFNLTFNGTCTNAPEPETYIDFSEETGTLSIYKRDANQSLSLEKDNDIISSLEYKNSSYSLTDMDNEEELNYFNLENASYSAEQLPWYEYRESITRVVIEDEISPISTANWFNGMTNLEYIDVSKLNTIRTTNMNNMFSSAGYNVDNFQIIGLDYWNVSSVTSMSSMFSDAGRSATIWNIGDLSEWDVSSVTNMYYMFSSAGYSATTWSVGNLSNWDVSNVTNMYSMFKNAGSSAETFNLNLSNWDVSSIKSWRYMFCYAGKNAINFILDVSGWNVSNVTDMALLFWHIGDSAANFKILGLSEWDTSNVTTMDSMFDNAGTISTTWSIGDISNWDVSNVTNMALMFTNAGRNASVWDIGDLSNWDVSSVTNMSGMLQFTGNSATTWSIGDISSWNTGNVTGMASMFNGAGNSASYSLDLSGWNVDKVTSYGSFGDANKITPPTWIN